MNRVRSAITFRFLCVISPIGGVRLNALHHLEATRQKGKDMSAHDLTSSSNILSALLYCKTMMRQVVCALFSLLQYLHLSSWRSLVFFFSYCPRRAGIPEIASLHGQLTQHSSDVRNSAASIERVTWHLRHARTIANTIASLSKSFP